MITKLSLGVRDQRIFVRLPFPASPCGLATGNPASEPYRTRHRHRLDFRTIPRSSNISISGKIVRS